MKIYLLTDIGIIYEVDSEVGLNPGALELFEFNLAGDFPIWRGVSESVGKIVQRYVALDVGTTRTEAEITLKSVNGVNEERSVQEGNSGGLSIALSLFTNYKTEFDDKYLPACESAVIFATGEILPSGKVGRIEACGNKLDHVITFIQENRKDFGAKELFFLYPAANQNDLTTGQLERFEGLGDDAYLARGISVESLTGAFQVISQGEVKNIEPFKGLESYGYRDNARFFGRNEEIQELYSEISLRAERGEPLGVLLKGVSGA